MKNKLLISFSGGKTSGYMLWWLFNEWPERDEWEKIVVFANTGKEVEGTLFFVDECSQEWNIPIWWVEYDGTHGDTVSVSKHKIVDYGSASRRGEPFEKLIKKRGIPSTNAPFCSSQLKGQVITSFLLSIGWSNYLTAIGIRADEKDRLPKEKEGLAAGKIYPLAYQNPKAKRQITDWWANRDFNLDIHPDDGNCDNCWKKDNKRLYRNAIRKPSGFDWWQEMTDLYGYLNPRGVDLEPPFNFYRGNISPSEIIKKANWQESMKLFQIEPFNSCNESCEAF